MMKIMAGKQRGISLEGFIVVVVILIIMAVAGMKIGPAYMQDKQIKGVFDAIVHDPEMRGAPVSDIRKSFTKRASIADIKTIKAEDIEIEKAEGSFSLSVSYSVKIPLVSNASLLLEFNTSSSK